MHVHIVYAHPEPSSYNGAMARVAREHFMDQGCTVTMNDLYASGFDPVERREHYANRSGTEVFAALAEQRNAWQSCTLPAEVLTEIRHLQRADLVVLQFPLWWHGPPAILKGWMDRVFVNGGLYTSRMRYDTGYFKGKRALVSVTTGAPRQAFGPGCRGGDLDTMLWPLQYSLHYMGFSALPPFVSYGVQGHGYSYEDESRLHARLEKNLSDWRTHLSTLEDVDPVRFPGWTDWDSDGKSLT